ncbi:hypothetical protein [Teichococcus vastitatis]|uniref:Uncharacterized protein n=1 Tax=Teichococcus vastitatis TaxID=2307076 RepID=A0ABS9WAI7_9PROT|nr:hypothetical protein [Pseudoroseomonas vastitatis]MCI0756251.1 hypothetical protein [Pseudoroseomonas vastitatis]
MNVGFQSGVATSVGARMVLQRFTGLACQTGGVPPFAQTGFLLMVRPTNNEDPTFGAAVIDEESVRALRAVQRMTVDTAPSGSTLAGGTEAAAGLGIGRDALEGAGRTASAETAAIEDSDYGKRNALAACRVWVGC